jgi:probable rRNA maturation factor
VLFSVAVLDEVNYQKLTPEHATHLCAAAFSARGLDIERIGEVSVALVSLPTIQGLNLKYRNVNSSTDVLSFSVDGPYGEMVGEIVVAPEYVRFDQVSVDELVVHGALHLAGMDHGDEFEGTEMAAVQEAVLRSIDEREG